MTERKKKEEGIPLAPGLTRTIRLVGKERRGREKRKKNRAYILHGRLGPVHNDGSPKGIRGRGGGGGEKKKKKKKKEGEREGEGGGASRSELTHKSNESVLYCRILKSEERRGGGKKKEKERKKKEYALKFQNETTPKKPNSALRKWSEGGVKKKKGREENKEMFSNLPFFLYHVIRCTLARER